MLHDNAQPHTMAHTLETLKKLKWEIMEHLALNPGLAPLHFCPSELLKETTGWRRFWCDKGIKNMVHKWLHVQPNTFYYDGIMKLVECWELYVKQAESLCRKSCIFSVGAQTLRTLI
jgi:hypothetical protein